MSTNKIMKADMCPNCGRDSIVGIHAGSTGKSRVLLHNYKCCRCDYDTDNCLTDKEARRRLIKDQLNKIST